MREIVLTKKDVSFINNIGSSYTDLVSEARDLILKTELFKLKIAKLAMKACTIRHGGRSSGLYTLNDFATDTGIARKSLSDWVITYKRVVSKIESSILTDKDWNTASRVSDLISKENSLINKAKGVQRTKTIEYDPGEREVMALMEKLSSNRNNIYETTKHIGRAHHTLRKVKEIDKYDKNLLLDANDKINNFIKEALAIQELTVKLMGRCKE